MEIEKLKERFKGKLIIVEGKRDKEALLKFEFENVYTMYEIKRMNLKKFEEVVILTDRDKKGKKLYQAIKRYVEAEGLIVNEKLRIEFFKVTKIYKIEDLEKLYKKYGYIFELRKLINESFSKIFDRNWCTEK